MSGRVARRRRSVCGVAAARAASGLPLTLLGSLVAALLTLGLAGGSSDAIGARSTTEVVQGAAVWGWLQRRCVGARERLPAYPWPVAPFHEQHPVRGYFGDPRTVITGIGEGAFSFHNGVDISAATGTRVYPVVSGVVVQARGQRVVVASSHDRRFQYIHIFPRVRVGEPAVASDTVLGTVLPLVRHVHLSEIRGMCVVNPLMPGHLSPFHDTQKPVVRSITFESLAGRRILPDALSGEVRVIADAYDRPAIPSPYPWSSMPVSPVLIRWRLATLTGRTLQSRVAVDFRVSLPPRDDFCEVYAPGTVQNFAAVLGKLHWGQPGRYLYDLTPVPLDTRLLRDGRYHFTVTALNTRGRSGSRTVTIEVRQRQELPSLTPLPDHRCAPTVAA